MSEISPPWVIAIINGMVVVGQQRPGVGSPYLEPVYQLMRGLTGTPQGLAVQCMATPVLMLSWKRMNLPADASVQPLDGLPKGEREEIEKAIKNAAGFAEAMRAQNTGLAIVPPGAKLPPLEVVKK